MGADVALYDTLRMMTVGHADTGHDQALPQAAHALTLPGVSVFAPADFDSNFGAKAAIALGNIVPFKRARQDTDRQSAPVVNMMVSERPPPSTADFAGPGRSALVLAFSLLAHAAVFAAFNLPTSSRASIGVQIITVELVLGADVNAGLAATPSPSEGPQNSAAAAANSERQAETADQPKSEPEKTANPAVIAETPQMAITEPEPTPEPLRRPPTETTPKQESPAPRREKKKTPSPANSPPSMASSGTGRGRSDANTNYRGLVAAHLGRYKQFPPDARRLGNQGSAVVTFRIDGAGRVLSARLVRSIGVDSLDREVVAMVNRASPFPPPPDNRPQSFSVPVSFQISGR